MHRIICLSCVHRSLKLLNDSIFVPPAAIYSLFHGFSSIRTAVAPSVSLDQRHGACSKTICVSRTCKLTVFDVHWRRVFLISTRYIERIRGAFCDDALYKLTLTLTLTVSYCTSHSAEMSTGRQLCSQAVLTIDCSWGLISAILSSNSCSFDPRRSLMDRHFEGGGVGLLRGMLAVFSTTS